MWNKIAAVTAVLVMIGSWFAWFLSYDAQVVKAEQLKAVQGLIIKLNNRIDKSALEQERRDIQGRIWQFEDRYGLDPAKMDPPIAYEYRCLKRDLDAVNQKLKKMEE